MFTVLWKHLQLAAGPHENETNSQLKFIWYDNRHLWE